MNEQDNVISLYDHLKKNETVNPINHFNPYRALDSERNLSKRVMAFAIDMTTIVLFKTAIDVAYGLFIKNFYFVLNIDQQNHLTFGHWGLQWSVTMVVFWTYFIYSHYTLEGKTVGKMVMGLRTINDEFVFNKEQLDYTPSVRQALRRTFGYFICYISFGTFFSFPFFSEDQRGIPDYFSATRTVSDEWLKGMIEYKQYESEVIRIDLETLDKAA
jgi:uncharacterized RDD family membrane protein YckC